MHHWEEFKYGTVVPITRKGFRVSLNKQGIILLNRNIYKAMGKPPAVSLFYDRINEIIGLKPVPMMLATAFPIKATDRGHLILASSFCRHHKLRPSTTIAFEPDGFNLNNGMVLLELKKAKTVSRPKKDIEKISGQA